MLFCPSQWQNQWNQFFHTNSVRPKKKFLRNFPFICTCQNRTLKPVIKTIPVRFLINILVSVNTEMEHTFVTHVGHWSLLRTNTSDTRFAHTSAPFRRAYHWRWRFWHDKNISHGYAKVSECIITFSLAFQVHLPLSHASPNTTKPCNTFSSARGLTHNTRVALYGSRHV